MLNLDNLRNPFECGWQGQRVRGRSNSVPNNSGDGRRTKYWRNGGQGNNMLIQISVVGRKIEVVVGQE